MTGITESFSVLGMVCLAGSFVKVVINQSGKMSLISFFRWYWYKLWM